MANEINVMVHPLGETLSAIMATGSCVAGDWLQAYQTSTDDMFAAARPDALTAGSVAVQSIAAAGASGNVVVGIAMNNAASGNTVNVAMEGVFIGISAGTVTAGLPVMQEGASGIIDYNGDASGIPWVVGRALTGTSASSKYALFKLSV